MPELPEVEAMRRTLEPLISKTSRLCMVSTSEKPPRKFITSEQIQALNNNCFCVDIVRKGKVICMVLDCVKAVFGRKRWYLFLHMGMTGQLSSKGRIPRLESLKESDEYPPKHTHLIFSITKSNNDERRVEITEVCFSDSRKLGSIDLLPELEAVFGELATDGLSLDNDRKNYLELVSGFSSQSAPIKKILLDQKRLVSGIGNYVADEVLYHCRLHPDQTHLTMEESEKLVAMLSNVLKTAVQCLEDNKPFPEDWIFHKRWARKKDNLKDAKGRDISFIQSAGRTSVIVPSIQKKRALKGEAKKATDEKDEDDAVGTKKRRSKRKVPPV